MISTTRTCIYMPMYKLGRYVYLRVNALSLDFVRRASTEYIIKRGGQYWLAKGIYGLRGCSEERVVTTSTTCTLKEWYITLSGLRLIRNDS